MGKNKKKNSSRVKEDCKEKNESQNKRNEVKTINYNNSKKYNLRKNFEDQIENKESFEGMKFGDDNHQTNNEIICNKNNSRTNNLLDQQRKVNFDEFNVLEEINVDIFDLSSDVSLAHSIGEDLIMNAGIAVHFRRNFGTNELSSQNLKIGDVGVIKCKNQYIFCLITKKLNTDKATMITIEQSLQTLLSKMKDLNLTKLGIPQLCVRFDNLPWSDVKNLIINIFDGSGIHIYVCNGNPKRQSLKNSSFDDKKNTENNKKEFKKELANTNEQLIKKSKNNNYNKHQEKILDFIDKKMETSSDRVLTEIDENLFNLPVDYSLAHCVAEDLRMGAGIAVEFKHKFKSVGYLIDQNLKIGDVGEVHRHNQYVFYLITKRLSNGKPTMLTMEKALRSLLNKMTKYKLTKLGIPKIGCGLDGLDWDNVKSLITDIFSGSGIHIIACIPSKVISKKIPPPLKVYITPQNLWEMEAETYIIIIIDIDQVYKKDFKCDTINNVNNRYPFKINLLNDIKNNKLKPGSIKEYHVNKENITCVFIKQNEYYSSLEMALHKICSKNNFWLAIQSGQIAGDNFKHIAWIVLILRSITHNSELWLCGDVSQTHGLPYDDYCRNIRYSTYNSSQV